MRNTERFCKLIRTFLYKLNEIESDYNKAVSDLAEHEGSEYYNEQMEKAKQERVSRLSEARQSIGKDVTDCLKAMAEKAENVPLLPPTEEQLRLINLLQTREKLTEAELRAAAITCKDNPAAMRSLKELQIKHEIISAVVLPSDRMDAKAAMNTVESLARSAKALLSGDYGFSSKPAALNSLTDDSALIARMAGFPMGIEEKHGLQKAVYNTRLTDAFAAVVDDPE